MDDSQGSDFLSESIDMFCDSPTNMKQDIYENLVENTKLALGKHSEVQKASFSTYFSLLLEDCDISITKSLDIVVVLLSESTIQLNKLVNHLNNAIEILQGLSEYIKTMLDCVALACCNYKAIPRTTGRILLNVFTHCSHSESIYGNHLKSVEKQLKDLFRTCHEMQQIYLMILEKHFIFDLSQNEEKDILIEALEMNLQIGEIVHKLDVKTMAEQWKGFTAICEKYSTHLCDNNLFSNCTKVLTDMIVNNLQNLEEESLIEKVLVRSIKVTSFIIKILIKVCAIFKHATDKNYEKILELLVLGYLHSSPHLVLAGKPENLIILINTNVMGPTECLLKELLLDEQFVQYLTTYDIQKYKFKDELLGFLLLVVATIKFEVQITAENRSSDVKCALVQCVFKTLPYSYVWFNMGLRFKVEPQSTLTIGLNEYLLIHTVALVTTMYKKQYNFVEECMLNTILGTDCISAMFSANLWTMLSRLSSRELLLNQIITLCGIYMRLENNITFENSPQKIHLTNTILNLFGIANCEDKVKIYKTFPVEDNLSIWSVLKINDFPKDIQRNMENIVTDKLILVVSNLPGSVVNYRDLIHLTYLLNIASSFSFYDDKIINSVVSLWLLICPEDNLIFNQSIEIGTLWCIKLIEALISLTSSMADVLCDKNELIKVLYIISKFTLSDCLELKLLLIEVLCKFCIKKVYERNKTIESLVLNSMRNIVNDKNITNVLMDANIERISKAIENGDFERVLELKNINANNVHDKSSLQKISNIGFVHKCVEFNVEFAHVSAKGNNFDLVDMDCILDSETDPEPQMKRFKLNTEVVDIINSIQEDILKLSKVKENINNEDKTKIRDLCISLQNIID